MHPIQVLAKIPQGTESILNPKALELVTALHKKYEPRRRELLAQRRNDQLLFDVGHRPNFLEKTKHIREWNWKVTPVPADLLNRRVEITGPVDRKMIINALNSPVQTFMADFEDSNSPTWENVLNGQVNLRDAVNKTISFTNPSSGKEYKLNDTIATLIVRPRGWHLTEKNYTIDGESVSASIFDFALYLANNYEALEKNGTGPYFYLPKLENYLEARLWNDIFIDAQQILGIPEGTIKATVLIETITAAFEMDEILYELKYHSAGLNCGRWDYIFSFIKKFHKDPTFVLPDRNEVTMDRHFLKSYVQLLIKTCHRRGAHAMGGMAAQIPIKNDDEANDEAMAKVAADKKREAEAGHDGTWVAHPGLANIATDAFNKVLNGAPNQLSVMRDGVEITAEDLLKVPSGDITDEGVRHNIRVGVQYIEAWLRGQGCVPLYNLMEDAATAEISRSQLWQWYHNFCVTKEGTDIRDNFDQILSEEMKEFKGGKFELAEQIFSHMVKKLDFDEFLTLPAYLYI